MRRSVTPNLPFRPRDRAERLAVARTMLAGTRVPLDDRDGFLSACLSMAGLDARGNRVETPRREGPRVTILICTYNRVSLLRQAVASARRQSWPCEIVVVDDGSTDGTEPWLAKQGDIRAFRHVQNRGKPAALDTGMSQVRGEAVLVLDDDDLLFPGAVAALAEPLFAVPRLVATWGDTVVFDGESGQATDWRVATRVPVSHTRRAVLTTIPAMPGATLIRMSAQRAIGSFEPSLIRGQDMDHFLRLSALGPIATVPLPMLAYRRHDGLRGSSAGQWRKHADPSEHRRRFLACVQPVFRRRWTESRHERAEGFAWATGLWERELRVEAVQELSRWDGPFSPHERWVRNHCGLSSGLARASARAPLLMVDDGHDGALEAALAMHAQDEPVDVVLPAPRDTLGSAQIFWPGTYRVASTIAANIPVRLRRSSQPEWAPPPMRLPPLRAAEVSP
jgi:GT2 family glycosyltransferase